MNNNSLSVVPQGTRDLITFTPEQKTLIKSVIAKDATDNELALFLYQAQRTGLDPLARQLYFQKYTKKSTGESTMTIITGIDGYRVVADRTGLYAGSDEPVFEGKKSLTYTDYGTVKTKDVPVKATVTVWKIVQNLRVGFSSSCYWEEYYPGEKNGTMWHKMPHVMLAKCAEAAALRKAFPNDLSGVYIQEEMEQAQGDIITVVTGKPELTAEQVETQQAVKDIRLLISGSVDKEPVTPEQVEVIKLALSNVFGLPTGAKGDSIGKAWVTFLKETTEKPKLGELTSGAVITLLQWLGATEANGYTPNEDKARLAKLIAG